MELGKKVVCIDDSRQVKRNGITPKQLVIKNKYYTVRGFTPSGGLLFNEVSTGVLSRQGECGWKYSRFIPIDEIVSLDVIEGSIKEPELQELSTE